MKNKIYKNQESDNSIIVSIGGGLGNQMFEYAFIKKLSKLYPDRKIEADIFNTYEQAHNGYELENVFGIKLKPADIKEIIRLSGGRHLYSGGYIIRRFLYSLKRKICGRSKTFIHQQDYTEFYPEFYELPLVQDCFYHGVWANEKYFSDIKEELLGEFKFILELDSKNYEWKNKIEKSNSVSIHIRRGDYVDLGLDIASSKFYEKAIDIIKKKVKEPVFYVFSDDITFSKKLFHKLDDVFYIEGNNGANAYVDMQLMSLCKHNIIANSTFSFWGAYLNKNPNKIVISPNIAYSGCTNPFTCEDWEKIDI